MFDAEIAAKLLNRWTVRPPAAHCDSYLDLLREGNLNFTHQMGRATPGGVASESLFDLESLVFVDGSRPGRIPIVRCDLVSAIKQSLCDPASHVSQADES